MPLFSSFSIAANQEHPKLSVKNNNFDVLVTRLCKPERDLTLCVTYVVINMDGLNSSTMNVRTILRQ